MFFTSTMPLEGQVKFNVTGAGAEVGAATLPAPTVVNELLTLLNTLPIMGPRIINTAMTTMATRTRISAYSTSPWPISCFLFEDKDFILFLLLKIWIENKLLIYDCFAN
jgi:hypothetical protein